MTEQLTPARNVFPPGDLLAEELSERGWSQTDFAEIIGRPARVVNEVISGKRGISPSTAQEIAAALGTSPEFWMGLESSFQLARSNVQAERITKRAELRTRYPVREMVRRGWVPACDRIEDEERAVLDFFGVSSTIEKPPLLYAAHRANADVDLTPKQEAWLCRVRQLGSSLVTKRFETALLQNTVERLSDLRSDPEEIRHVPKILAEGGVRLVIVEPFAGSKIDGVCMWEEDSPIIGLTLRFDRLDHFWFYLRHELEHVIRGDGKLEPVVDIDSSEDDDSLNLENSVGDSRTDPTAEIAANASAADFCVPTAEFEGFIARVGPLYTDAKVSAFAERVGVHPALVAGQLRRRFGLYHMFKSHMVKVRSHIVGLAPTDGFGFSTDAARTAR